jgi:hypothetical protein
MHFHVLAMNNVRPHLSHDQSLHSTSHVTVAYCLQFPSSRAIANNGLSTTSNHPYVVATSKTKPNNTFYATTTVAMDRRQFMPRYTADKVVNNSGIIEPAKLPRAPRAPPRTAPPILPPRNPKRLGLAPRSPEKVAQIWDPTLGTYIPRQPSGGFAPSKLPKPAPKKIITKQPLQRSITTNTFQQHTPPPPLISSTERRQNIGRSLHEEIKNLRQSYIDLQSDDVFAPALPPRRSVSAASLRSPVRNFSLPTYSSSPSPSKQQASAARPRPLRRVRSRSVNLGPVAEASELPELPVRRESPKGTAVSFGVADGIEVDHALTTELPESKASSIESQTEAKETNHPTAALEFQHAVAFQLPESTSTTPTTETEPEQSHQTPATLEFQHAVPFQLPDSTSTTPSTLTESKQIHKTTTALVPKGSEGTCKCCGSNRKALAMNPKCCIDHAEEKGRVCFRCWSDRLAEGLSKHERKEWLCCVVCGKELVMGDAKRLASRKTILR